jgi:hypothetical protein
MGDATEPTQGFLRKFLQEKDTLRILLTAAVIPVLGWLFVQAFEAVEKWVRREAIAQEVADQKREKEVQIVQDDVTRLVAIAPLLNGNQKQQELARAMLQALSQTKRDDDRISQSMLAVANQVADAKLASADPAVRQEGIREKEQLSPVRSAVPRTLTVPTVDTAISDAPPPQLAQVAYIQVYGTNQLVGAQRAADLLRGARIPVPGIENVMSTNPVNASKFPQRDRLAVRYFRSDDRGAAQYAAWLLKGDAKIGLEIVVQDLSGRNLNIKPGLIELWWPCSSQVCPKQ